MPCGRCHKVVHLNHCSSIVILYTRVCVFYTGHRLAWPPSSWPARAGWKLHTCSLECVRPAAGRPRHGSEKSGHFIPNIGSNRKAVSFRKHDRKKRWGVQGQVYTNPHRKGKISRRKSPGYNLKVGPPVSWERSSWVPALLGLISCDKKKTRVA